MKFGSPRLLVYLELLAFRSECGDTITSRLKRRVNGLRDEKIAHPHQFCDDPKNTPSCASKRVAGGLHRGPKQRGLVESRLRISRLTLQAKMLLVKRISETLQQLQGFVS
jgi:hypothetical protein